MVTGPLLLCPAGAPLSVAPPQAATMAPARTPPVTISRRRVCPQRISALLVCSLLTFDAPVPGHRAGPLIALERVYRPPLAPGPGVDYDRRLALVLASVFPVRGRGRRPHVAASTALPVSISRATVSGG